jgi:hypothetical protein
MAHLLPQGDDLAHPLAITDHLTKEGLTRIYLGMSAPANIRSLHGNVRSHPWAGAVLRALRFTFASFISWRQPRS